MSKTHQNSWIFLIPSLMGFSLFYLLPFGAAFKETLMSEGAKQTFVGLKNYISLFQNEIYTSGLKHSLIFIGCAVPIGMTCALLIALGIKRLSGQKKLLQCLFLVPLVIPTASIAFFWKQFFAPHGLFSMLVQIIGITPIDWLQSDYAMPIIIFIFVWKNIGYNTILFTAGLYQISMTYYESAGLDGANGLQVFRYITLPNLSETTLLVFIMSVVNSFKVFKEIYLIAGGYPHESIYMLQHYMNNMFLSLNYVKLSTSAYILIFTLVLVMGLVRQMRRKHEFEA